MEVPTRQLARNSGLHEGVLVERMRASQGNVGLDAARGVYVDLVEAGIVDATKVVRLALENAVSVAGILMLTEATMTEVPEKKPEPVAPPAAEATRISLRRRPCVYAAMQMSRSVNIPIGRLSSSTTGKQPTS